MNASTRWLGWTAIVLVGHMTEQLMFGLVELQRLKDFLGIYDTWFRSLDTATVTLVTIVATLVYLLMFSLLKGGLARLVALEVLGLVSVSEIHHAIETIAARAYTPGLVTSIPYVICGVLLMRAAVKEYGSNAAPRRATKAAVAGMSVVLLAASAAGADAQTVADETGKGELARKLANPLANLVSVPLQTTWTSGMGPSDESAFLLKFQPVVPFAITDHWNVIGRMILPVISQPAFRPTIGAASGVGDIEFSAFVSPVTSSAVTFGAGPLISLPSTNAPTLGTQKYSAGPTVAIVARSGRWTYGGLWNQVWSFAGAADRPDVSQMYAQPFVAYTSHQALTVGVNLEAAANWNASAGARWTAPLNVQASKLLSFGPLPASYSVAFGEFLAKPAGGPSWQIRSTITLLLPRER